MVEGNGETEKPNPEKPDNGIITAITMEMLEIMAIVVITALMEM